MHYITCSNNLKLSKLKLVKISEDDVERSPAAASPKIHKQIEVPTMLPSDANIIKYDINLVLMLMVSMKVVTLIAV